LVKTKAYINGKWTLAASGKTFAVDDPATGNVLIEVSDLTTHDTEAAIQAAENAMPELRKMTGRERGNMLKAWHKLIAEHAEDIAILITAENGKPLADARGEVAYANSFFEWFGEEASRMNGQTILASGRDRRVYTIKQAVGVAGLITP
jgi:succinate-semialdehyde dehydrogenase / glutarate-semialdehyde dehydrogenase